MGVSTSMKLTRLFLFSAICMAALTPAFSATTIKMCLNDFSQKVSIVGASFKVRSYSGSNYIWKKEVQYYDSYSSTYLGPRMQVFGFGMCFTSASQVKLGDSPNTIYCWCKTIRPEITDWEYVQSYGNNKTCAAQCPRRCATEYYVF